MWYLSNPSTYLSFCPAPRNTCVTHVPLACPVSQSPSYENPRIATPLRNSPGTLSVIPESNTGQCSFLPTVLSQWKELEDCLRQHLSGLHGSSFIRQGEDLLLSHHLIESSIHPGHGHKQVLFWRPVHNYAQTLDLWCLVHDLGCIF